MGRLSKALLRIDAAIHALKGKEVHWDRGGNPCEIVPTARGFKKQEIKKSFPNLVYQIAIIIEGSDD